MVNPTAESLIAIRLFGYRVVHLHQKVTTGVLHDRRETATDI